MNSNHPNSKNALLLVHPRILAAIRHALRRNGFKRNFADGVAEVQTRTLEWARTNPLPDDVDALARLVMTVAINWAIDERRKFGRRAPWNVGLCEEPDEALPPPSEPSRAEDLDVNRQLDVLFEEIAAGRMPRDAAAVAIGLAEGKSQREIAEELGVTEASVHRTAANVRRKLRERLAALGLLTTVVLLLAIILVMPMGGGMAAASNQRQVVVTQHSPSVMDAPDPDAGALDDAGELRAKRR
jgi:DNA-directed RNA polymerase specialized sigma24 family protein